jgi:hypothetical protein
MGPLKYNCKFEGIKIRELTTALMVETAALLGSGSRDEVEATS